MKYRKLRIAWSVAWGVVAVLICVVWVQSYSNPGRFPKSQWEMGRLAIYSTEGVLRTVEAKWIEYTQPTDYFSYDIPSRLQSKYGRFVVTDHEGLWGFNIAIRSSQLWVVQVPYWFLVSMSTTFAMVPWICWSKRFSLRTLLLATTYVAVVVGLIVWVLRR